MGAIEGVWGQARPTSGGLVSWVSGLFGPRSHFFYFSLAIVGIMDMGMPFGASEYLDVTILDRYIRW